MMSSSSLQCYSPNSSRGSNRSVPIPLEPLKQGHRMDPHERIFLDAAERGDKATMIRCLQGPNKVNVNCTNILGRSAIQIAVDNENVEIVELLLQQDGVKIGDALLYAIREGVYKIVEMLIDHHSISRDMLGMDWSQNQPPGEESADYSADISPVILAAHCNQFEILQLLLSRGAKIDKPHDITCTCTRCRNQVIRDSLRHSLRRIHTYRALASPAWISLTSSDPILTSFKLSWELECLASRENEFKDTYMQLSEQCKTFACDLLDQCRTTEEVIEVLNRDHHDNINGDERYPDRFTLDRLKFAIKYEQKQFVAHPHCQQLLTSIWYAGLPGWRRRNSIMKFLTCVGLIFLMPFLSFVYLIFPRSRIGQLVRSPFMKFLYHSTSFGVFLFLLASASANDKEGNARKRGPPPTALEGLIVIFVTGFIWAECKQLWEEGLKAYIRQWWNWLDFIMLSLYLCTFSLRTVAFIQIQSGDYGPSELDRKYWPMEDPTLISEGLFAVANVFSFARIIYLFLANPNLGPLQISLGCMLIDIAKFLFIFMLVLASFACGLNQLYSSYQPPDGSTAPFYTLDQSVGTLIWSLFGLTQLKDINIKDGQPFTKGIGELLFMVYHAMAIIVLINMLIAMMSSSFQDIEAHGDREWKFARTKLWTSYFDEGSTLSPPFNLLVSPKSVYYCIVAIKDSVCKCRERFHRKSEEQSKRTANGKVNTDSSTVYTGPNYKDIMRRLVSRYILQFKKQSSQDGVNEDDLLEIKQDISSLRFELREDRKRESGITTAHMERIKKDIMKMLQNNNASSSQLHPTSPVPSLSESRSISPVTHYTQNDQRPNALQLSPHAQHETQAQVEQQPPHHDLNLGKLQTHQPAQVSKRDSPPDHYELTQTRFDTQHDQMAQQQKLLEELKRDIIESVRAEVRGILTENASLKAQLQAGVTLSAVDLLPPFNSELYHTHLYTQL
ncbi:transient-receptor-potential-like protein [Lingula anatina]|uniref:Transient-receptor-potential-like protein n=1 Tax=Lingula anatina TaxID=7574 RepID=A0A1S3HMR5_LINAN|nr:transient-receptor-potential-like protein [Lingula anatina]|eukprot:XP_013386796.1 transient-receptor-potential-like protein [Lingula anatina]